MTSGASIPEIYKTAANGREDALVWLVAFHAWCHAIDDTIDEHRDLIEVVDRCSQAVTILSSDFYHRHHECLGPLLAIMFAKYRASVVLERREMLSGPEFTLKEALRITANDIVLAVAYLCGGNAVVQAASNLLWPAVLRDQLSTSIHPATTGGT